MSGRSLSRENACGVRVLSPHYPDVLALREAEASRAALRQGPMRRHPLKVIPFPTGPASIWICNASWLRIHYRGRTHEAETMDKRITIGLFLVAILLAGAVSAATDGTPGADSRRLEKATFAGGCFWCMEEALDKVDGVVSTTSGYTGGMRKNPTYEEVSSGETGHAESVEVLFDPAKVSYAMLLQVFWHNIDPTTPDRQFCDYGLQYRSAIFYHDETQKRLAEESKKALVKSKRFQGLIVTEIVPASEFYPAEEYHQNFYEKNPIRYRLYKFNCGRAQRLEQLWGKKE